METARESLAHLGKWGSGRLRLGASTTACQHLIPPVLREFKESFPEHVITIEPGDTPANWSDLLLHQRIDLALCLERRTRTATSTFIHCLPMNCISSLERCILGRKAGRVDRSEIPRQKYILYSKHSITFRLVERLLSTAKNGAEQQ